MKTYQILGVLLFSWSLASNAKEETEKKIEPCDSAKEFITTFEFLKSDRGLDLSGDLSVKTASEVAKGCSGAAKRFIQTVQTLRKSDLIIQEVLATATDLAKRNEAAIDGFNSVFKRAYAEDGFDLDLKSSLDLARTLSVNFSGNIEMAVKDFNQIADFCMNKKQMDLPKSECAEIAQRVASSSDIHGNSAAEKFVESTNYMMTKSGPSLSVRDSLSLTEELVKRHPVAFDNFKVGYEYAVSKQGLSVAKGEAIAFAKKIAFYTVPMTESELKK